MGDVQSEAVSQKCAGCKREFVELRHCADGVRRCRGCRSDWLGKIHAIPAKQASPSVGEQARFV